jgi:hypothetical protein
MHITETPIYKAATAALEAKIYLEAEVKHAYNAALKQPRGEEQMAIAFYYLSLCGDLKAVEQYYAETTMNLIVACRALGIEPTIPTA